MLAEGNWEVAGREEYIKGNEIYWGILRIYEPIGGKSLCRGGGVCRKGLWIVCGWEMQGIVW